MDKKNTITLWQNTKTVKAIYGYIFKSNNYSTLSEDKGLMKSLHCDVIIEEDGIQEKLRPEWRKMLCSLEKGDTIIVTKLSHALRGIRELGVFLTYAEIIRSVLSASTIILTPMANITRTQLLQMSWKPLVNYQVK